MNIILIPSASGNGKHVCLSHRQLLLIVIIGVILLPALLGVVTFQIQDKLRRGSGGDDQFDRYARELTLQSRAIDLAKRDAAANIDALTRRMGQMQAQLLRLNELGGRLTRMAGLDGREFSFGADVAQGGPETGSAAVDAAVIGSLEKLSQQMQVTEAKLHALEASLRDGILTETEASNSGLTDIGSISSGFGPRINPLTGTIVFHRGVDIAAASGAPIHALADGVVSYTGEKASYGNVVEVTHASGLVARYAHTLSVSVQVGDKVTRGQVIASAGSSGRSAGPHIHIEVLKDGHAVNPAAYLRAGR